MKLALNLALVTSAAAFAPSQRAFVSSTCSLSEDIDAMMDRVMVLLVRWPIQTTSNLCSRLLFHSFLVVCFVGA
jgi:hypothetical protein